MIMYVKAKDGKIEVYASHIGKPLFSFNDPQLLADVLITHEISSTCFFSPSMDQASKHGFSDDQAAYEIWERAIKIIASKG